MIRGPGASAQRLINQPTIASVRSSDELESHNQEVVQKPLNHWGKPRGG
jgi:hypothetical protein